MRRPTIHQSGFGLVEVLITAVILAIGLLGLSSLQSRSIQVVQEADNFATAAMIAQDVGRRMLANPTITALGRQGYLAIDLNNEIAGDVPGWITDTLTANPDITRCYAADNTESCVAPGGDLTVAADQYEAMNNLQLMDQVELRDWANTVLPEGEILICFDSTDPLTDWSCDDVATRVADRLENVFTVKVRWRNIISNQQQIYAQQFTAPCIDGHADYCG